MAGGGCVGSKADHRRPKFTEAPDKLFPAIVVGASDWDYRCADRLKQTMEGRTPLRSAVAKILKLIDDLSEDSLPLRKVEAGGTVRNRAAAPAPIHDDTLTGWL
ncbi:hypothetical protein CO651_27520 [Rhizobium phaseoli]|uniref:Uncharacterized protein n=1 Tax=Rhizobium etli (strain CIAT 652) TaxID=491916 RepID=B3Q4K3_RHIE6|nr:hypothetical protein RHECIAT_PC0000052 [Rhizobium etli CIAT 652]PDS68761.1 hypothetical protein CO651_27520 [Rhizobium phaseoli]